MLRRERGHSRGLIVEACDGAEHIRAGTAVADSRAAGALVNDRRLDARLAQQIGFEQVGLFEGHTILVHPYTQPSAAFVLNECFHDELPPFNLRKMEKEGHSVPLESVDKVNFFENTVFRAEARMK